MEMRPIPNFFGYYATDTGQIYSERSRKILRTRLHHGQLLVNLAPKPGCCKTVLVARLVATAWLPAPAFDADVLHKDLNPENTSPDNLYWATRKQAYSRPHIRAKRREQACKPVRATYPDGHIERYNSVNAAGQAIGKHPTSICCAIRRHAVCAGARWEHE